MKGLLQKDYYLVKSTLPIILIVFSIVGIAMSFLTSTWVLTIIATVMLGMIAVTTINMDKTSGWCKASGVLPVSKKCVVDSKNVLYLLMSSVGFIFGIIIGIIVSVAKNQLDFNTMFSFISIAPAMALISGSITIPCGFLFSEEKNMIGLIIAYPISALLLVALALIVDDKLVACGIVTILGIIIYSISWVLSRKFIADRDIT